MVDNSSNVPDNSESDQEPEVWEIAAIVVISIIVAIVVFLIQP